MSILSSISKIGEVVAIWLDPQRRKEVRLREAIASAAELLKILRKEDGYATWDDKKLKQYEIHYQKRFDAWRNG